MNVDTHSETAISASPDLPSIEIVREFDAQPEQVFRAHVDPDLIVRWLRPDRLTMRLETWEPRTGGSYRYVHSGEDGSEHEFYGSFHEVRDGERIVQTFGYVPVRDSVCLETLTLEPLPGNRTRLVVHSVFSTREERDAALASGMETGIVEAYTKLDALLAG